MSVSRLPRSVPVLFGLAAAVLPRVAHACPMCFNGADSNSQAFVYGSLFLMVVPVTAIGSLVYWAYRRIRDAESAGAELGATDQLDGVTDAKPSELAGAVVLQLRSEGAPPSV